MVIIGGGFGGVNLALQLKNDPGFQITLVDKNNYNFFPPLIYQVAQVFWKIQISVILSGNYSGNIPIFISVWENSLG